MRTVLVLIAVMFTSAFGSCTREAPPEVVEVKVPYFVRIDPALVVQRPVAEGPLAQCPQVASDRKKELETCNSQLQQIGTVEGTPVPK